jgi:hypothetical protein
MDGSGVCAGALCVWSLGKWIVFLFIWGSLEMGNEMRG